MVSLVIAKAHRTPPIECPSGRPRQGVVGRERGSSGIYDRAVGFEVGLQLVDPSAVRVVCVSRDAKAVEWR